MDIDEIEKVRVRGRVFKIGNECHDDKGSLDWHYRSKHKKNIIKIYLCSCNAVVFSKASFFIIIIQVHWACPVLWLSS